MDVNPVSKSLGMAVMLFLWRFLTRIVCAFISNSKKLTCSNGNTKTAINCDCDNFRINAVY